MLCRCRFALIALILGVMLCIRAGATPVTWGDFSAVPEVGVLDASAIPTSTGTGEVRYHNVNMEGYDIVVTTRNLGKTGNAVDPANNTAWWFEGSPRISSSFATITVRFYLTSTTIPYGIQGTDMFFEDAEIYEQFGNFSYFDEFGTKVPVLFNDPMFSYSSGPVFASNYSVVSNAAPQQGGTQLGPQFDGDMTDKVITGFTIGAHRTTDSAGSVLLMRLGDLGAPPIVQWRQLWFGASMANPSIAGDGANPSGDGTVNLLKYAFGLDPTQREDHSGLPQTILAPSGVLEISFKRIEADTDISYIVETTSDLVNWVQGSTYSAAGDYGVQGQTIEVSKSESNGVQTIVVDDTVPVLSGTFRSIRVRISRP